MKRFDVLSRDLDVFAPHFLEASAGTGKTFAIEHLVTRQIIEGIPIEQILVVTFTRAATRELKLRIRRNLIRAKLDLLNPTIDYLQAISEKKEAGQATSRIEAALINYDAAQVYTLHGFCHRILKEFAFEADMALIVSDPDEREHLALLEEKVKSYLKEGVSFPDYSASQLRILLNDHQGDVHELIQSLINVAENGKEIAPMRSFKELHEAFLKGLQALPATPRFVEEVERVKAQYKGMTQIEAQVEYLGRIVETKACSGREFDALLAVKGLFLEKMHSGNVKVRAKEVNSELIHHARRVLLPSILEGQDPSRLFLRLARDVKRECQALLQQHELLTPDGLLVQVEKALGRPQFVEKVREKYRAVIIDEFQDTDPIQWRIFKELFVSHLSSICLVGDPKQSIYAFRNADVYTYLSAASALGDSAKKYLSTNYRSTPSLVEALNALFLRAKEGWMALPGHREPLQVLPVKAGSKEESNEIPVQFFVAYGTRRKKLLQEKVFPYIASEIIQSKAPYHDIAILVKDRYQAKELVAYLKECRIPASFKRGKPIKESDAYFAMQEVLDAASSPFDLNRLKIALGSPCIGWTDAELHCPPDDPELLKAKAEMVMLHHILSEKGFGPFFAAFLGTPWGKKMEKGDFYQDLRKLAEYLIEEKDLDQEMVSQEEKGSIAVMTMHMSKGLEFDTVFALGVASRTKPSDWITIQNKMVLFDPLDPDCQRALAEQDAEKMRQLYVCLTRAKRRLYIPLFFDEEPGTPSPVELFFAALGGSLEGLPHVVLEEMPMPLAPMPAPPDLCPQPPLVITHQSEPLLSFTALAKKEVHIEAQKPPSDAPLSPHTLPLGSETGHRLHLLFEKIFQAGLHHPLNESAIAQLIDEPALLTWVISLLKKPIAGFALADVPGDQLQAEMEFFFPVPRGMMKGFADLVFEFQGKYYLLDWKSNYLGPSDADYTQKNIIDAMERHDYFLQASIYAEALKRFVKLFDKRPFSECFGGAIYYFIRGSAPYHFFPEELWNTSI